MVNRGRPAHEMVWKKRGKIWYVRLKGWNNFRSTGQTKKAEAERKAFEWRELAHSDKLVVAQPVTFGSFVKGFYSEDSQYVKETRSKGKRLSKSHLYNCDRWLKKWLIPKFCKSVISEIRVVSIDEWLMGIEISNATKNHLLSMLNSIFNFAVRKQVVSFNPAREIERFGNTSRERNVLSVKEWTVLFGHDTPEAWRKVWPDDQWYAYFLLLTTTGTRTGEIMALRWSDIMEREKGFIFTVASSMKKDRSIGATKTNQIGTAFILARVKRVLDFWKANSPFNINDDELIFQSHRGYGLAQRSIDRVFSETLKKQGLKHYVPHSLRNYFITRMKEGNLPTMAIMASTNHTTQKMIDHYSRAEQSLKERSVLDFATQIEGALS